MLRKQVRTNRERFESVTQPLILTFRLPAFHRAFFPLTLRTAKTRCKRLFPLLRILR